MTMGNLEGDTVPVCLILRSYPSVTLDPAWRSQRIFLQVIQFLTGPVPVRLLIVGGDEYNDATGAA